MTVYNKGDVLLLSHGSGTSAEPAFVLETSRTPVRVWKDGGEIVEAGGSTANFINSIGTSESEFVNTIKRKLEGIRTKSLEDDIKQQALEEATNHAQEIFELTIDNLNKGARSLEEAANQAQTQVINVLTDPQLPELTEIIIETFLNGG